MSKKTIICPGCGKKETKQEIDWNIEILEQETKEIQHEKIDGIKWCAFCK